MREEKWKASFDAWETIGNVTVGGCTVDFYETEFLTAGVVVFTWGVVAAEGCEGAVGDSAPDFFEVGGVVAEGRAADVFGAGEGVGRCAIQRGGKEEEVLRAGFGVDWEEAVLGLTDVVDGCGGGHVNDEDWDGG